MKISCALPALCALVASALFGQDQIVYVGTFTTSVGSFVSDGSEGIYAFRYQPASGKMTGLGLMAAATDPGYLAINSNHRFLYAVNEVSNYHGLGTGGVSAFSIDPSTKKLKFLNTVSSKGGRPCHLMFDKSGKWLFVANFETGSVGVLPVHDDGTLGEAASFVQHSGSSVNPERQAGPHAHSSNLSPDGRFVLVADLGLDRVFTYQFNSAKGVLTPANPPYIKMPPGSGPRHLSFSPNGDHAYMVSEMGDVVTAFDYDASSGGLREVKTLSSVAPGFKGFMSGAEIAIHPSGKFVYASNRGEASISIFRVDSKGSISAAGRVPTQGKTPRNFAIDPSGTFLFAGNQDSGTIVEYRIDLLTGSLTPTGEVLKVPAPVCITFAGIQ